MKLPAKTEYACIAMLELAAGFASGRPVRIRSIAGEHGIPSRFLVQILLQLKGAGLVASTRGAAGGYRLARPPEEILMSDVVAAVDGGHERPTSNCETSSRSIEAVLGVWQELFDARARILESVSLADLLERSGAVSEGMYYI